MENPNKYANVIDEMDLHLRNSLLIQDGEIQTKKLWENTFIKHQIDRRNAGEKFNIQDHIRAMVYSMISSGAPWKRVEERLDPVTGKITNLDKVFQNYDLEYLRNQSPDQLIRLIAGCQFQSIYTKAQMKSLSTNISKFLKWEMTYGSIDAYYQTIIEKEGLLALLKSLSAYGSADKLTQLGPALAAEYLRNVGYDMPKPDRHITRILGSTCLGLSEKKNAGIEETFAIVSGVAKQLGKPIAEVDYILWSYCAKGYGEICTKKNPKCALCVAKSICKHNITEDRK